MNKIKLLKKILFLLIPLYCALIYADEKPQTFNTKTLTNPMNKKLSDELVKQVKMEFNDAENYLQYTSFFEDRGLYGFVQYLKKHYFIEIDHGFVFYNYIIKRGINFSIVFPTIDTNHRETTPLEIFQYLLKLEIEAAKSFERLTAIARENQDEATILILQKFAQIQVNEIYELGRIVKRLKFAEDNPAAVLLIDQALKHETNTSKYVAFNGSADKALERSEHSSSALEGAYGGEIGAVNGALVGGVAGAKGPNW